MVGSSRFGFVQLAILAALLLPGPAHAAADARAARRAEIIQQLDAIKSKTPDMNKLEPLWVELAELGDEEIPVALYARYLAGFPELGVKPDIARFVPTFQRIAEKGNRAAQFALGTYYRRDAEQAIREGKNPGEAPLAAYQWHLLAYVGGLEADTELRKARSLLAADQVARAYQQAQGVMATNLQAYGAAAHRRLGNVLREGELAPKDAATARQHLQIAAGDNDAYAQFRLGELLLNGDAGVPADVPQGLSWLGKAAAQEHAEALYILAVLHASGRHVAQDYAISVAYLTRAVSKGYAPAQVALGAFYMNGVVVEKNPAEAAKLFSLAMQQGNAQANLFLGHLYATGQGVKLDLKAAFDWYRRAAEMGLVEAQVIMGDACLTGIEGALPKDVPAARKWYELAAAQGHEQAKQQLQSLAGSAQ